MKMEVGIGNSILRKETENEAQSQVSLENPQTPDKENGNEDMQEGAVSNYDGNLCEISTENNDAIGVECYSAVHEDGLISPNKNDDGFKENEPYHDTVEEQIITVNDPISDKSSSGNCSDSSSENVYKDSNILTLDLTDETVKEATVIYNGEPSLADNIECSKIINTEEAVDCINSENHSEDNTGDQSDTTQNLGATVVLSTDSEIVDSVNVDINVELSISDNKKSNSDLDVNQSIISECEIPVSVNQIQDNTYLHEAKATSESEIVTVNHISDTENTKEELNSSAIISVNQQENSKTMADINDKINSLEEEISELRLQLNASQQVRASLELQLTQKEEIIIKSQTESLKKHQSYKQEIKQLKDKLDEKNAEDENTTLKELQETNKSLKLREAKLLSELNARKTDEQNYRKIMDEFEKTIGTQVSELQKLNEEHSVVKRHLATLELAFSDVLQKYERSKKIIEGFKCNEEALRQSLASSEENIIKGDQKYESLKAHAKAQIEKCNQEILLMREQYDTELHKLTAIVKRLEIKNASLTDSLDQKNKECSALAALCDEVTGKV